MAIRVLPSNHEELMPLFESLQLSPDAVYVTDSRNRIVFWNNAARVLFGIEEDEALGSRCHELLEGCDQFENLYCGEQCPVLRIANRGDAVRNFTLVFSSGSERHVTANVSLLQLRSGGAGELLLLHIVRPVAQPESRAVADAEAPPRVVAARDSADVRVQKLTARETEVLGMMAAGRSTPEIAERLNISQLTARSHIQNILEKLEVHSKVEAVAFAFQKSLI